MSEKIVGAKAKPQQKEYPLESAPGGFVVLRRLKHGESTDRLDEILAFKEGPSPGVNLRVLSNWKARLFDFEHCIVNHNLGDEDTGVKFDFRKEDDVYELDENVGDEIQGLINQHHGRVEIEEDEDDDVPETDPNS
jgi:hypothetical protein